MTRVKYTVMLYLGKDVWSLEPHKSLMPAKKEAKLFHDKGFKYTIVRTRYISREYNKVLHSTI